QRSTSAAEAANFDCAIHHASTETRAVGLCVGIAFDFVRRQRNAYTPSVLSEGRIPSFVSVGRLDHAKQWRFETKRRERKAGSEVDSRLGELNAQQLSDGVQRARVRVHIEDGEVGPAEGTPSGGLAGMLGVSSVQHVRTAPGSIPDLRVDLGMAGERILL